MAFHDDDEVLPRPFGRTILDARIGEGGMAEVFRARLVSQGGFEKTVCVKRILPHLRKRPGFAEMFHDEARLLSGLHHENIVQVFDFGEVEGALFLVMELIDGCSLSELNKDLERRSEQLGLTHALQVGIALAGALAHAHAATRDGKALGIVHRDVTPHNVLLGKTGAIKLTDFGVALAEDRQSRTETGALKGKLSYMAPEQVHGDVVDARADQFALGIVLWECLTGKRLFAGKSELVILEAVTQKPIPRPSTLRPEVPPAVDQIVMTLLQRERARRFPSMAQVERDLKQALLAAQRRLPPGSDDELGDLRGLVLRATGTPARLPASSAGSSSPASPASSSASPTARTGPSLPLTTVAPDAPRGTPVVAIVAGVVAFACVIGVGIAGTRTKKPASVVDAGVVDVVLPDVPVVEAARPVTEIPLPRFARRAGSDAVVVAGGVVDAVFTAVPAVDDGVTTVLIAGVVENNADLVVTVNRRGTTRLVFALAGAAGVALRLGTGAVVDRISTVGNLAVRPLAGDGGAGGNWQILDVPAQAVGVGLARGEPAALRAVQGHTGVIDVAVLGRNPLQVTIGDGALGTGGEELLADAADAAALRRDLDRVLGHSERCARRCEDLRPADPFRADGEEIAATVAAVAKVRQDVGACLACLDSMGVP